MSSYTVQQVKQPSDTLVNAAGDLFVQLMKNDLAAISLSGGEVELMKPMALAVLRAGILDGEFYTATATGGDMIGFTLWMPPGQEMFSTDEQRKLGLLDFMSKLPEVGKNYYRDTYIKEFPAFVAQCLGPTGKIDSWWLHNAMVRPENQRQGVATALISAIKEKASQKGQALALAATTEQNANIYQSLGFALKGHRTMPSPWGEWPLYVLSWPDTTLA